MINEEWKEFSYPVYSVSNLGRVRNNNSGVILPVRKNKVRMNGRSWSITQLMKTYWSYEWIRDLQEGEECVPVRGYEGYFITNRGRLFSTHQWGWLSPQITKPGSYYQSFHIRQNGSYKVHHIHTLVGRHFLSDWEEGFLILHKEETLSFPEINFPDNLWVGTHQDNSDDKIRKGRDNNKGVSKRVS